MFLYKSVNVQISGWNLVQRFLDVCMNIFGCGCMCVCMRMDVLSIICISIHVKNYNKVDGKLGNMSEN